MFQKQERIGLVIYLYYNRDARKLLKFGDLYYHSKRSEISRLKFVKEVKPSAFDDIDRQFVGNLHREETAMTLTEGASQA